MAARATPGGSDRPTGSSIACAARSPGCARTSSGARRPGCPPERSRRPARRRSFPGAAGTRTRRSGAALPPYASAIRLAVVHHTAGANGYTAAQSPSIVRAIELYHVKGNGWNDIGYNFLVDRFGTVFEGRFGGIERNVIGAHAEGFNTGSVGVAVMGEYSSLPVSAKARDSLARLLAWRLDLAHVDPASTLSFISGGNARFPAGLPVFLRTVSGHRDTGFTDCPGTALYNLLNTIAGEVATIGLPKLYAPVVTGAVPGTVRFKARLSSALPWTVDVYDAAGNAVRVELGARHERRLELGCDAGPAGELLVLDPFGGQRHARGRDDRRAAAPLAFSVTGLAADPETVTPNDDTVADETTITYTLTEPAQRHHDVARRFRRTAGDDRQQSLEARRRARVSLRPGRSAGRRLPGRGPGNRAPARVRRPPRRRSSSAERSARSPPPDSRSHPMRTAWQIGSGSASSSPPRRRSGCGSSSRASGSRRRSRARSSRVRTRSSGTAPSGSAACSTASTRRSSRRSTRSRRRRSRCRSAPTHAHPRSRSSSAAR